MKRPLDTSQAAHERQFEAFRQLSPEDRLRLAAEMSDEIRALAEAGIRSRHPDLSDEEVREALADVMLGPELASAARRARRLPSR